MKLPLPLLTGCRLAATFAPARGVFYARSFVPSGVLSGVLSLVLSYAAFPTGAQAVAQDAVVPFEQVGAQSSGQAFGQVSGQVFEPSGAMRAPLNIVPPVMQRALGAQPVVRQPPEKLAPRVVARQSKRAVRAVAAAPGSTGDIVQVGQLGALQDAPIGLEDGFGRDLWRGARLAFITGQIARLPEDIQLQALRDAELTLYRSTTAAPVGTVDGTSWYAARLNRFLALGDTGSVLRLEALAGGAAQDAYAAKAVALAYLGKGDAAAACARPLPARGTRGQSDSLPFFMQLMVYCQLRVGEFEKAGLTLQLNEKTLGQDKFFRELAFLMAAQAQPVFGTAAQVEAAKAADQEPPLVVPSEVTPMQLALLQLAGQGVATPLDKLPPYFMAALAQDYAQPTATQLGAAHLAMRAGSLSAERFSQMSQLADLSAFQTTGPETLGGDEVIIGDIITGETGSAAASSVAPAVDTMSAREALNKDAPDGVFLAAHLLQVDMALPEDQPMALANALRAAQARGLWFDMVMVLEDRLKALTTLLNTPALDGSASLDGVAEAGNVGPVLSADPFEAASAVTNAATNAVPIIAGTDRAVLQPAYLALQTMADGSEMPQTILATDNAVLQRLMAYQNINDANLDPLADLLAGLSGINGELGGDADINLGAASGANIAGLTGSAGQNLDRPFGDQQFDEAETELAPADTRPHPIVDWVAFEATYEAANAALQRYLNRELAVYQGLGFELAESFQPAFVAGDGTRQRMDKLAENKWIGDLMLTLVVRYAGAQADDLSEDDIVSLLAILRKAGLSDVAHDLGAEIIHAAAARLSITAPIIALPNSSTNFLGGEPASVVAVGQ